MDLETAYLQAAIPEPRILLHQQLLPYSVGHEMLLKRFNSPFASSGPNRAALPGIEDLFLAVLICCHTYDEGMAQMIAPDFDDKLEAWGKLCGPIDLEQQLPGLITDFELYQLEGWRAPEIRPLYKGKGKGRAPGAPFLALLLLTLIRDLHFTRTEALNCPFGWAVWLFGAHFEREGRGAIPTEHEETTEDIIAAEFKKRGWERLKVELGPEDSPKDDNPS